MPDGAIPRRAASALGVSTGARSRASTRRAGASACRRRWRAPALRRRGLEPVERAQTLAGAFGDEAQERRRPGDRLVAVDQTVGGIAAEAGERGAVAEAAGRISGPHRHEDRPRRSAMGDRGEQCLQRRRVIGDAGRHPSGRRLARSSAGPGRRTARGTGAGAQTCHTSGEAHGQESRYMTLRKNIPLS
jgi:hypothetical protein